MMKQVPGSGQRDRGRAALPGAAALAVLGTLVLATAAPARAADPRPPQLAIGFTAEPAPIVQGGLTKLFYELTLTNVSQLRYTIVSIAARGGDATATFAGVALERIVAPFDTRPQKPDPKNLVIEGGQSAIVYLELDLGHAQAPAAITHELRIADAKGEVHTVSLAPELVLDAAPVVVAPPHGCGGTVRPVRSAARFVLDLPAGSSLGVQARQPPRRVALAESGPGLGAKRRGASRRSPDEATRPARDRHETAAILEGRAG